jgi:hypothetical protein
MVNVRARPLHLRKRPGTHWTEALWASGTVWTGTDGLATNVGFKTRSTQPRASHYTDYAILATLRLLMFAANNTSIYRVFQEEYQIFYGVVVWAIPSK